MGTGNGAYILHKTLEKHIPGYSVKGYNPYLTLFPFALKVAVNINTKNVQLIHTSPDYAIFFMKKSMPSIITFHNYVLDSWMVPYNSILQNIHYKTDLKLFTKLAVSRARVLTAVSKYTAKIAKKDLKLTKDIKVIYNGIDSNFFYPDSSYKTKKKVRVFFSGNLSKRKGAHWLPAIAKKLNKNITIHYTSGLQDKGIIKPQPNMIPTGNIAYTDMPEYYRQMDILIMPTVREGFGLAIAEAMACGLPIVASNCSAIPELVDDYKGGFLCPVGDVNAFAEKINILADSPKKRKEMGDYNRAKVEKLFPLAKMVKEYKKLFEETLCEKFI